MTSHVGNRFPVTNQYHKWILVLFLSTVPYGYFGINYLSSDTNPLSMYLLPVVVLVISIHSFYIFDIEMGYLWIIFIFLLSIFINIEGLIPGEALIKLFGISIGFCYFFLASRGFGLGTRSEKYLIVSFYPILFIGLFQVVSLQTGLFNDINEIIKHIFVSNPVEIPTRITLLASEPSFIAFQVPLLFFLFYKYKRWMEMTILMTILAYTRSVNVYISVFIFCSSIFIYKIFSSEDRSLYAGLFIAFLIFSVLSIEFFGLSNRIFSISNDYSVRVRYGYILSVIYTFIEYPLGVGSGQYGTVSGEIFDTYNISMPDRYNLDQVDSVDRNPWSFIFGLLAEGGILIIPGLLYFAAKLFRICTYSPHSFAVFTTSSFILLQTYPPATPYIWIAFGLVLFNYHNNQQDI